MSQEIQKIQLQVGQTVDSHYKIEKLLGAGSFGDVFLVRDTYSQTLYAMKMLRMWSMAPDVQENLRRRFELEYNIGRIQSDFLVQSRSYGELAGNPYILMEYCPDGDLLKQSQCPGYKIDFSKVALNVLMGLEALHQSGRVHRDLKPENVLIKPDGTYALSDFGIAGDRNNQLTKRGLFGKPDQIFGTYAYMPPEQAKPQGKATILPTTDIFSFGVMMYKLITGHLPFGPLSSTEELAEYQKRGAQGRWDRSLLQCAVNGNDWTALIDQCLIPDYKKRISDVRKVMALVPRAKVFDGRTVLDNVEIRDNCDGTRLFQKQIVNGVLLRQTSGEEAGKVYKLDDMLEALGGKRLRLTLGRIDNGVQNDIPIKETHTTYISRYHCTFEIDYDRGEWVVRDGQWLPNISSGWKFSTNGTYVNSAEAGHDGLIFRPGDIISVGDVKFRAEGY